MKYIIILLLIIFSVHPLSYAKYSWCNNNKFGAAGVVFLTLLYVALPSVFLLIK